MVLVSSAGIQLCLRSYCAPHPRRRQATPSCQNLRRPHPAIRPIPGCGRARRPGGADRPTHKPDPRHGERLRAKSVRLSSSFSAPSFHVSSKGMPWAKWSSALWAADVGDAAGSRVALCRHMDIDRNDGRTGWSIGRPIWIRRNSDRCRVKSMVCKFLLHRSAISSPVRKVH